MGIALLGIAFALAFGSNSRLVHWTFAILGLASMLAPPCYEWYDRSGAIRGYETRVAAFEREIPELAKQFPYKKTARDEQTGASMGWNGSMWVVLSSGTSVHMVGDEWDGKKWISEPSTPSWMRDALRAGVDVEAVPDWKKPAYSPPEAFSLTNVLLSDWIIELPGFTLLCIGIGLVIGIRAQSQDRVQSGGEKS